MDERKMGLSQSNNWRSSVYLVLVLASLLASFGSFASSKPYLRMLQPPPLRFDSVPALDYKLLLTLGPLPTGIERTNAPSPMDTEPMPAPAPNPEIAILPGPMAGIDPAVPTDPFPGVILPPVDSVPPAEPISPQLLMPYLCAPGTGTNQPARPFMPLYFNPPHPQVMPSSTATYSTDKP